MTLLETDYEGNNNEVKVLNFKIPGRIVMTNSTISLYTNDNFTSNDITLDIGKSYFSYPPKHPDCFKIKQSPLAKIIACALPTIKDPDEFLNEWDYHFNLFKYQCRENRDIFIQEKEDKMKALESLVVI